MMKNTTEEQVKILCIKMGISVAELARRCGKSPQTFSQKMKRKRLTPDDLKEIADVCGIDKPLSTHIARHTFATIALANKVSIESIAKMLGYTDIRTTKIYAKIMDRTISSEMQAMRQKFAI